MKTTFTLYNKIVLLVIQLNSSSVYKPSKRSMEAGVIGVHGQFRMRPNLKLPSKGLETTIS